MTGRDVERLVSLRRPFRACSSLDHLPASPGDPVLRGVDHDLAGPPRLLGIDDPEEVQAVREPGRGHGEGGASPDTGTGVHPFQRCRSEVDVMTSEPVLESLAIRYRRLAKGVAATGWTVFIAGGLPIAVLGQDPPSAVKASTATV